MRKVSQLGILAFVAFGVAGAPALAESVTVGRFYVELAKAKNLVSGDAAAAENNLRRSGVVLPALALEKNLTEGDMQSISTALGLKVTTAQPGSIISETQMSTYLASFGGQIKVKGIKAPGSDPTVDAGSQARKKRKRRKKSRHEPI